MDREYASPASRPPMSKVRGIVRMIIMRKNNDERARRNIRPVVVQSTAGGGDATAALV